MNSSNNKASGFTPSLEPIFEIKSDNVVATADLALPVKVEIVLDILGRTWKEAIGAYSAPSVYFTAGISTGEGKACNNGIELCTGAKDRVYSSALGIWECEFKALGLTFYKTGLGCITKYGWDPKKVEPTTFFNEAADTFGGQENLASAKTLKLIQPEPVLHADEQFTTKQETNQNSLRRLPKTNGFRLIQDAATFSTMVSGTDGGIYMTNNSAAYDISAPWGGLEVDKNIFSYDVFGRLIWYLNVVLESNYDVNGLRYCESGAGQQGQRYTPGTMLLYP